MTSAFKYTSGPTTRTYYSDLVSVAFRINGQQRRLLSGDMETQVHDLEVLVTVGGVFEQTGADDKSAGQVWLDLLAGTEIEFQPDTDGTDPAMIVVPDLSHVYTAVAIQKGHHMEGTELRLISKSTYQPADSAITNLEALRPSYGNQ